MRTLIAILLLLGFCPPVHDILAYTEETLPINGSSSAVRAIMDKDIIAVNNGDPETKQTGKEWESYLTDIGKFRIVISLDGFKLHNVFVQGNATFSIICQFYLGEDYHPKDIDLILGEEQLDSADAARVCLSKWTLSGFVTNRIYRLVLSWEHNKGYTTLTMTGDEMSLSIKLRALILAFLTKYAVIDRIIRHLELTFVAEKPPPAYAFKQVDLMAAEEIGEYE
jgi:hypothetical protein